MTMIFYENALRIRIPHEEIYRIHQHLDFFIQEEARVKTPYSFKIMPGFANDASVFVRTVQPLHLSGERKQEIFLKNTDTIRFSTMLAVIQRSMTGNRQTTQPPDKRDGYVRKCLFHAGFSIQSLRVDEPKKVIVKNRETKHGPSILIPASVIYADCTIDSVAEAEKALVYGIGKKRIFGFGFLQPFRVNDSDEFL
ncbi:type I-E CRISPR-associated protein Cas6/Cse3/CasE [Salmonella enterica subsp. enterica]|nr:type I-E CRISPR-associated protein Cas6/Cse3/CasE [Salmonella enterica subsp. enterica]